MSKILKELRYRVTTSDGETSEWRPLHTVLNGKTHFDFPSGSSQWQVVRLELCERTPFPGPGWYGQNDDQGLLKELRWFEEAERDDVPAGWVRWSERRRWL